MSEPAQQPPPGAPEGAAPGAPPARQPAGAVSDYRLQHTQAEVQEVSGLLAVQRLPSSFCLLRSNSALDMVGVDGMDACKIHIEYFKVGIICENVDRVIKRDVKLSELDDRADALKAGASVFESNAAQLKRKYWWKNCKMMIMMGVICAIVVVVIVSKYQKRRKKKVKEP